jgi:hypothetical protein
LSSRRNNRWKEFCQCNQSQQTQETSMRPSSLMPFPRIVAHAEHETNFVGPSEQYIVKPIVTMDA